MNSVPTRCNHAFDAGLRRWRTGTTIGRAERGLTLVELMVAMAIGLFIVLIATTIYLQGVSTVAFRFGQSENLNNSRYALSVFDTELSKAGFRRDPKQTFKDAFPAEATAHANECQFAEEQSFYVTDKKEICLRYQARDPAETDCVGTASGLDAAIIPYEAPPAGTGMFVEKYFLDNGKLMCAAADKTVAVADGVRDMVIQFGVDQRADPAASRHVDQYQTTLPNANEVIRSLRYAILLSSTAQGLSQGIESSVCQRWEDAGGAAASCDTSKGRLFQLATGTLTLRNLMP